MERIGKMTSERIGVQIVQRADVVQGAGSFMAAHLSLLIDAEIHIHHGHAVSIAARVDARHVLSAFRGHFLHVAGVVMSIENEIKTLHILSRLPCGILLVVVSHDAFIHARMQQANHEVRILFLSHNLHPSFGTLTDVLKTQSLPDFLWNPVGNGRGDETNHSNLQSLAVKHLVRLKIRFARLYVDGIRSQDREAALLYVFVKDVPAHLDVVVANHRHIITDVVADVSHPVTRVLTMRVEIISGGFSL